MEFIRGTTLVHLKIRCWGGEKKASRDNDIQVGDGGKLPPERLLDLGRKKIFPKKALDPLLKKRKSVERLCLASGTRFMGGFAIPDDKVDEVVTRLDIIKSEFESELKTFLQEFDQNKQMWIDENDEFAHIIRDQVPDRDDVAKAFSFSYHLFKLEALDGFEPDEHEVANQVLHEVGMTCKAMSDRLMERSRAINGKTLADQVVPLINKLDTLSFGNGRIIKVLGELRSLHDSIPLELIDQEHPTYGHVLTFLSMCSDSMKLERIIEGEFSVAKLLEGMKAPAASVSHSVNSSVAGKNGSPETSAASQPAGAYF